MIRIVDREMTTQEFATLNNGFDVLALENGNPIETAERLGFVAKDNDIYIGSISGLAYKSNRGYNSYFFLSDLYVEKPHRNSGVGSQLLEKMEQKLMKVGIKNIWTWTAGYEAPKFYQDKGYSIFAEMKNWYYSGHSRFGLIKKLM